MNKEQLKADYDTMIAAGKKHLEREINEGQVHNVGQRAKDLASVTLDRKALGK